MSAFIAGDVESELPLVTYSVTVEKESFYTTTLTGILVSVGGAAGADVKLSPGAVQEVVEAPADVSLVETATNSTGGDLLPTTATPVVGSGNPYLGGGGPRSMQIATHITFLSRRSDDFKNTRTPLILSFPKPINRRKIQRSDRHRVCLIQ